MALDFKAMLARARQKKQGPADVHGGIDSDDEESKASVESRHLQEQENQKQVLHPLLGLFVRFALFR